jgi:phosphoribosylamine---glycine ligase
MNILILGSGGREHALAWKIAASPLVDQLYCAPGNAGIAREAQCIALDLSDHAGVIAFCKARAIDLVVVGPEGPLAAGIVDDLERAGIKAFGPSKAAARLEGSKGFTKDLCKAHGIPTAAYQRFTATDAAKDYVRARGVPIVIKADGLAAGKGVVIAQNQDQALQALQELLVEHRFGTERVLIEEYLEGEELSLLALCDGQAALPLASAQDYKRIFDGDQGPNTGGMGSYSPVPSVDAARAQEICAAVHQPVLDELARRGIPFHGVLYAGLMMTPGGAKVLEFNVRFGDPETQAILPRLRSDLLTLLEAAIVPGGLAGVQLEWAPQTAVSVVLASRGYPASSSSGDVIRGLDAIPPGVSVTHAGTARSPDGDIVTAGGRVLSVTGLGDDPAAARAAAYAAADMIEFSGKQLRRDIALRAVDRGPA